MAGQVRSESYSGDKKRPSSDAEDAPAPIKRVKKEDEDDEKKFVADNPYLAHTKEENDTKAAIANNPYLAHMKEEEDNKNGFRYGTGLPDGSALHSFKRRETTAKQAEKAEDGSESPFTGEPHSQQYFKILKTRRTLPIHKQR